MAHAGILSQELLSLNTPLADLVRVSNIHAHVNAGADIWGRLKTQPVLVSVTLSLSGSISSAAVNDTLDGSTVHYGQLSKNVAAALAGSSDAKWEPLLGLAERIFVAALTTADTQSSILQIEVDLVLIKASRYGDGVRFRICGEPSNPLSRTVLSVENLRIPTIIGVNSHERSMQQVVVVSIEIHNVAGSAVHYHFELEQLVVKTVEESSFETLESLVEEIAARCVKFYLFQYLDPLLETPIPPHPIGVRVRAGKPSAIPIADTPTIEIFRACGPQDLYGKRMLVELGNKRPTIPFPLAGRLDEFLKSWKQD